LFSKVLFDLKGRILTALNYLTSSCLFLVFLILDTYYSLANAVNIKLKNKFFYLILKFWG